VTQAGLDRSALGQHPLPPVTDGDKDSKGSILVIAGSREVPGAALLSATAAMRAGAGKLTIATAESVALPLGLAMLEAMVVGLPDDDMASGRLPELIDKADAIVAGPGMLEPEACAAVAATLIACDCPVALDAGLLHELEPPGRERSSPPILLPHSGELAALLDCEEKVVERDPVGCGRRAAERYQAVVLVKGPTSHVVTPGGDTWTYDGGSPGLGVSGSGDVLAGIVGGLLARGADPLSALLWAVWLHGEAGAALTARVGPLGFLARQIADEVPALLPR
jgi:ADP-dependent NAD(P)H-hydrate dehydratase